MFKSKYKNVYLYFILFFIILLFKWDYLFLPFYSEEKPWAIYNVLKFSVWQILTHSYSQGAIADHPTLLPVLMSPFAYFFKNQTFPIHLALYSINILGLSFFYRLLVKYNPTDKNLYWLAPLSLICIPNYFIHMSNISYEIFAGSLAIITLYYRLTRQYKWYLAFIILLSQTRETVLAYLVSFLIMDLYLRFKKKNNQITKFIYADVLSIFLFSTFFLFHFLNNGKLSSSQASNQIVSSLSELLGMLGYTLHWLFIDDNRWVYSLLSLFSISMIYYKKEKIDKRIFFLFIPLIFYALGMSLHKIEAYYYLHASLYFLYGLFIYFILRLNFPRPFYFVITLLMIGNFFVVDKKYAQHSIQEDSTEYKEITLTYKKIAVRLKSDFTYRDKSLNLEWPLIYYLHDESYGYIFHYHPNVNHYFNEVWSGDLGHNPKKWVEDNLDCKTFRSLFDGIVVINRGNDFHRILQIEAAKMCNYKFDERLGNDKTNAMVYLKN